MDKDKVIQKMEEYISYLKPLASDDGFKPDEIDRFESELSVLKSAKKEMKSAEEILTNFLDCEGFDIPEEAIPIIVKAVQEFHSQFQSVQSNEKKPERKPDWMPDDDRVIGIDIIKRDAEIAHEQTMKNIEDHFKNLERNLITSANNILRSCYQVIERKGKSTNWEALEKKVKKVLGEQRSYLYPDGKVIQGGLNTSQFNPVQSVKGEGERTAENELPLNRIIYIRAKNLEYAQFCEWFNTIRRKLESYKHSESKEQKPSDEFHVWVIPDIQQIFVTDRDHLPSNASDHVTFDTWEGAFKLGQFLAKFCHYQLELDNEAGRFAEREDSIGQ